LSFSHSSAALLSDLVKMGLTGQFFRVMSSIVSFVSRVALFDVGVRDFDKRNQLNLL
jgi:hypothetical protein